MEEKKAGKKNIGLIGIGYWGRNLLRNFHQLGVLRAVCDSDPSRLSNFREAHPDLLYTTDLSEILKDPQIDAVAIAAPASLHFELARKALEEGKDVFIEKPLALDVNEGAQLVSLAEKQGRILMVGHLLQYHPAILKLKSLIDEGELGKIDYIYSTRLNLGKIRREENILWSFAPHDISVILMLLGELPKEVSTHGGNYLHPTIADVTFTNFTFGSGVRAHIFVSWLHPYKEQKMVVVGEKKMAVFDDVSPDRKLLLFPHKIEWINREPVPSRVDGEAVPLVMKEPLLEECLHFLDCVSSRKKPKTDGVEGLRVLQVLQACQSSLHEQGRPALIGGLPKGKTEKKEFYIHPTSVLDEGAKVGEGTKVWHFSHIMAGSEIGRYCNIGQNVVISPQVKVGNGVKIQNNVSVYTGVVLEDDVFCGPSMVFTNVINPRSAVSRKDEYKSTLVKQGATLGANATIVCGVTIGRYAFIGAGAVVTKDAPDFALIYGNPAVQHGWMCRCGVKLRFKGSKATCSACGMIYKKDKTGCHLLFPPTSRAL
jgi:UDP-2-acetamido-3-amino-2,3-dideoxy-glucuronate N-acetyltransferase